jgi:hypothetical protein
LVHQRLATALLSIISSLLPDAQPGESKGSREGFNSGCLGLVGDAVVVSGTGWFKGVETVSFRFKSTVKNRL